MVICKQFYIVCALTILTCSDFGVAEYNATERDTLIKVRDYFMAELHSNWTGPPCIDGDIRSHWKGIHCSQFGHVTEICLENMGLNGSIPTDAFINMTKLTGISFRNNSLAGKLPELSQLVFLKKIDFSDNKYNGVIPFSLLILNQLEELSLENNDLSGVIPPFNQQSLKRFNVSNNHLTGRIPDTAVLDSFDKSSYLGNDLLCGIPLNVSCRNPSAPSSPNGLPSPASSLPPAPTTNSVGYQKSSPILGFILLIFTM
ncbi:hypothetical protein KI387_041946, partial [Taxus chinensis]